jgi:hypothetical protein
MGEKIKEDADLIFLFDTAWDIDPHLFDPVGEKNIFWKHNY